MLTAPRAGTHFVVRSIAVSKSLPFKVTPYLRDDLPDTKDWVIGTHEPFLDINAIREAKAKIVIVERNPLDHVLSYFDHPANVDSFDFVERVRASRFVVNREMHSEIQAPRFSYDELAQGRTSEWERLSELLDFHVRPESLKTTKEAEGEIVVRYGDPGRWRSCLSPLIAAELLKVICS